MKATELMIGDLVSLTKTGNIAPCVVTALHPKEVFVLQPEWSAGEVFSYDTIYPIPLTAEILEKNGWGEESDWMGNQENEIRILQWRDSFDWVVSGARVVTFRYVHELQHALRICGLNDLADNFKI